MTTPAKFAGIFSHLESRDIVTHQYRCVRVRNRHATCSRCADACTSGCISLETGQIVVDNGKCIGCGTCCTVCPTGALEAANPNDSTLLRQARRVLQATGGTLVPFASENTLRAMEGAYDPSRVVEVVNLGRLEETLLVQLALAGTARILIVRPDGSDECDQVGLRTAELVCESASAILAAWGREAEISLVDKLPSEALLEEKATSLCADKVQQAPVETRGESPISEASTELEDKVARPMPDKINLQASHPKQTFHRIKVMKDGTLPHFTPDRREGLLDALYEMGEPVCETVSARIWGHAVIDPDKCTGCRMCATFCPTGALFKFADADKKTGIEHSPGDCVKCLCCVDACRFGAITIEDDVRTSDVLSGAVERFLMPPEELFRTNPHSILNALRGSFKTERIYER